MTTGAASSDLSRNGAGDSVIRNVGTMAYRQDIQIVRAIAVALVLGYHLGLPGFGNGFIGVDIFFVVSGFLMQKLCRPDESAIGFLHRRAARLLPAYFATVVSCLVASFFLVLPDAFRQVGDQAVVASLFASNFGFWSAESYFSPLAFAPLLHLWSLGVELQYYLLVPLLVMAGRRIPLLLWLLIVGSLGLCLIMVTTSPKTSFFMMPLRLWEFGLGMVVARWRTDKSLVPGWVALASLVGLCTLMLLPLDGDATNLVYGHPALGAVIACAFTAAILAGEIPASSMTGWPARAAIRIGDMSYSLYLVHFPLIVLVFYQPFGGTHLGDGGFRALALLPVSLALAYCLYETVERRGARFVTWPRVALSMAVTIALAIGAQVVQARRFDPYSRNVFAAFQDRATYRCGKTFRLYHPSADFCELTGNELARRSVLLVGDSHADAIKRSFAGAAARSATAVWFAVSNEPLLKMSIGPAAIIAEAKRHSASRIYLHYHSGHLTPKLIDAMAEAAERSGIGLSVIMPVPESSSSIPRQLFDAHKAGQNPPTIDYARYNRSMSDVRNALAQLPHVEKIEIAPLLCAERCPMAATDGTSYYFDANHLTLAGAARLEPLFDALLRSEVRRSSTYSATTRRLP